MMVTTSVRTACKADEPAVVEMLTRSFASDAIARWLWPNDSAYQLYTPVMMRVFWDAALANGSAHCTDGYSGAALWLPPGGHSDQSTLADLLQRTVPVPVLAEIAALFQQSALYRPAGPYWYLPVIGVDPAHQRQVRSRDRAAATTEFSETSGEPGALKQMISKSAIARSDGDLSAVDLA